jgi:hypothetical protein
VPPNRQVNHGCTLSVPRVARIMKRPVFSRNEHGKGVATILPKTPRKSAATRWRPVRTAIARTVG